MTALLEPSLLLDLLLALLLAATVFYSIRLNNRLSTLRDAQAEMARLAADFDKAVNRSRVGMAELKQASGNSITELQAEVAKARDTIDELSVMSKSAATLADRLEGRIGSARDLAKSAGKPPVDGPIKSSGGRADAAMAKSSVDEVPPKVRSDAERELIEALRKAK